MNELEGLVATEVFGGPESHGQVNAGGPQRRGDLLEPPTVELEVLMIRLLVARRGQHRRGARAPHGHRRVGVLGQFF